MEDHRIAYRKRQERVQEYKELAAKGCYSVITIVVGLVLLRPLMVDQILSRGQACAGAGLLGESKRQFDKALLLDSDCSEAWFQLARIYKTEGDRDMAYGAFQKACQSDSKNRLAHYELGMMYVDDDRHQLAIPYFERVRVLGPARRKDRRASPLSYHKAALDMLASCYEIAGDLTKAEFTLEEIRVCYPGSCDADARLLRLKEPPRG